jgi:lantibiotic modifying enzyme
VRSTSLLVEAAMSIGMTLTREAVWYDSRCTWVGHCLSEVLPGASPTVASLGPDLYSGTAGIGWFLAELAAATGDPEIRRTAEGAIRHALSRSESVSPSLRASLHSGWLGVALASSRAGLVLGSSELERAGRMLARRVLAGGAGGGSLDIMSGNAGAVLALLALDGPEAGPEFLSAAERL